VTGVQDPAEGAAEVAGWARSAGVPVRVPAYGEVGHLAGLTWQVVGPSRGVDGDGNGEEGSTANNASVVLLVVTEGVRILLAGDIEPEAQQLMSRAVAQLRVDVLKVPHHGSRYQDSEFLSGLGAGLAVISVGQDNDYGHPAPETIQMLQKAGMLVRRTDQDGDIAVVVRDGQARVVTSDR